MVFVALVVSLIVGIMSCYMMVWRKRTNEYISLRRCPNPDCIRCQRYQSVQQSARRRLPFLIREWQNKNRNKNAETIFCKIIEGVRDGPPPLPESEWKLRRIRGKNATGQYPTVLFVPDLTVNPIVTQFQKEACLLLSSKAASIQESLMEEYLASQFNGGVWQVNDSGAFDQTRNANQLWEALYLLNQGKWIEENTRSCSKTYSLVKQFCGLMDKCMFGNVFFSVLYPGTKIEEHCGPTNVRHRLHFPLLVPSHENEQNAPSLKIMSKKIHWTENETFVFDDSLVHAAEYPNNEASEVRVVLIVDLWHPDLTSDERQMLSELYPPVT